MYPMNPPHVFRNAEIKDIKEGKIFWYNHHEPDDWYPIHRSTLVRVEAVELEEKTFYLRFFDNNKVRKCHLDMKKGLILQRLHLFRLSKLNKRLLEEEMKDRIRSYVVQYKKRVVLLEKLLLPKERTAIITQ